MLPLPPVLAALRARIGYRGAFLLFLALLNALFGFALWHGDIAPLGLLLPLGAWIAWWLATGALEAALAFSRADRLAFAAAAALKTAWGLTMIRLWLTGRLHDGWIAAVIWLSFAGLVMVVSGWPEPVHVVPAARPSVPSGDVPPGVPAPEDVP